MVRRSLVLVLVAVLAGPTLAQEGAAQPGGPAVGRSGAPAAGPAGPPPLPPHLKNAPTPKSPGPGIALASFQNGEVYVRLVVPVPRPNAAGQVGKGQDVDMVSFAQVFEGQSVQASTADGKKIGGEELSRRLSKETTVVLSAVQFPVDPMYLRVLKSDTLILLLPGPQDAPSPSGGPARSGTRTPGNTPPASR